MQLAEAAQRGPKSCAARSSGTTTPITCSTRRRFPTPSTTACSANCRRSRRNIRTADAPIRRRSASAAARWPCLRRCAMRVPMLSIRTETDTEPAGARAFDARVRRELGLAECRSSGRVRGRTQVRRPGDQPALREWRAGAGGHARRRRNRRGRDAEHPHRAHSIPLRLAGHPPRFWKCAARPT
jgi:hypothetical protein